MSLPAPNLQLKQRIGATLIPAEPLVGKRGDQAERLLADVQKGVWHARWNLDDIRPGHGETLVAQYIGRGALQHDVRLLAGVGVERRPAARVGLGNDERERGEAVLLALQ